MSSAGDTTKPNPPGMFIKERNPKKDEVDGSSIIPRYEMDPKSRGVALIINNERFENDWLLPRDGSKEDVRCMTEVLKDLNFKVIVRDNKTVKEMKTLFDDIQKTDHSKNSCFVAVILSHGGDGDTIYGFDRGGSITVTELVEHLLPDNCPALIGKPKLFFIQACRGTRPDEGVEVCDAYEPKKEKKKTPIWADVLISRSTVPGYYAWENSLGSWYIQSLAHVLKNHGKNKELTTLLTMVNAKVAFEYESKTQKKQSNKMKEMPEFSSMLTRQLYF